MDGFAELHMHPDVPDGLSALAELGIRLVTLSNASIAQRLLSGGSRQPLRAVSVPAYALAESAWINRTRSAFPNYFQPPTLQVDSLPQLAHRLR
jgi:2-haloacid dehalogenase